MTKLLEHYDCGEWLDTFKPIKRDDITSNNYFDMEGNVTHGWWDTTKDDIDIVKKHGSNYIWTECYEGDTRYVMSGMRLVNRMTYYVTEVSHGGKDIVVDCKDCRNEWT